MIHIGPYKLDSRVILAPMAGVTDRPFRSLCRSYGAALTPSEMLTSNTELWDSEKNRLRRQFDHEARPRVVQIAGSDPDMMARAAYLNVQEGAQIIDINMGCPAKKVLKKAAGSALLKDEDLVRRILHGVVQAVDVPVSLKIRTGWSPALRNGVSIARIAEDAGVSALAVHGRTRECMFRGEAEYDTIAAVKQAVSIPVFANGDIDTPQKAASVLEYTGADGVMIGRGAQGRPWLFRQIDAYLKHRQVLPDPAPLELQSLIISHLDRLYEFYGEYRGVLLARKHVGWYCRQLSADETFRSRFNKLSSSRSQIRAITSFVDAGITASSGKLAA